MLAYIAPIVVFGLVIFVHELGHFLAAKLMGVYAPRFSIGFGPALFRRRRGETEYVLALLPLGGYVRMASRHDAETAFIEGGSEETGALKPGDAGYDPDAMIPFGRIRRAAAGPARTRSRRYAGETAPGRIQSRSEAHTRPRAWRPGNGPARGQR